MNIAIQPEPGRPPLWAKLTIEQGNAAQAGGLAAGFALMRLAAKIPVGVVQVALMLLGFAAIYLSCHAIAHYAVGRLAGIEFSGYGIRGTDHPENYPPGMRDVMAKTPMYTAMTKKESMRQASPLAKALMFSAGETSSSVVSMLAALYAWRLGLPGAKVLFWATVVFSIFASYTTATVPKGDYYKAFKALRAVQAG